MHDLVALLIGLPAIAVWAEASRCRRLPRMYAGGARDRPRDHRGHAMNWAAVTAVIVGASRCAAWLLRRFDRRVGKAIAGHIDAALANSAAWLDADGSHDRLVLDRNEELAWLEIELGYDRSTP